MRCDEVRDKLPEYLAGVLDESHAEAVSAHLKNCERCTGEMKELQEDATDGFRQESISERKIVQKTRMKFHLAIVRTVVISIAVLVLIYLTPNVVWMFRSQTQQEASRVLMNVIQFSQPNRVNMWGNSDLNNLSWSIPLKIGARSVIGRGYGQQMEYTANMSVVSGKITVPVFWGANFLHPEHVMEVPLTNEQDELAQMAVLERISEISVATVDYSLNEMIGLEAVSRLLSEYDVEVIWMAVEAGIEDTKPDNMSFGNQQALQWGIPGKLSTPNAFFYAELTGEATETFEQAVMDELRWIIENKHMLKVDSQVSKVYGIDYSPDKQAQYVLDNGLHIYGLRITGPSSELLELGRDLDVRTMTVVDRELWNWW